MRAISKRTYVLYALMAAFLAMMSIFLFRYMSNYQTWVAMRYNKHLYPNSGTYASAGKIVDRDGVTLAHTEDGKRKYANNRDVRMAMLHIVGDSERFINTSIQKKYLPELVGYNLVDGFYRNEAGLEGNDIELTLDSRVCKAAYSAMGGRKGTVGVMNYKTGEMICMISMPTFDPNNKPNLDNDKKGRYTGVYINRLLSAKYPPGSTFKLVTAAAAIDNIQDLDSRTFVCKGKKSYKDGEMICNGVHGKQSFEEALANSCNVAFSELAIELGEDVMTEYAEKAGVMSSFSLDDISTEVGSFDLSGATQANIGWAGIGQYTVEANPYQMLMYVGAIANDGLEVQPYVIKSIRSPIGIPLKLGMASRGKQMLSSSTARKLGKLMRNNVKSEYGDKRFKGLNVCGKTGTAEVNGKKAHSWFVGYVDSDKKPYAFVVVAENSGSGLGNALPIAAKVLDACPNM